MIWCPEVKRVLGLAWEVQGNSEYSYQLAHDSVTRSRMARRKVTVLT